LRRRQRRQRRRRLRLTAIVAGVVALVGALIWVIGFSPVLAADAVEVTGVEELTPDEVVAAAQVPLGEPLIRLDTGAVVARLQELPLVASAQVVRHLGGTVELRIVERRPVYAQLTGGTISLVDAAGRDYAVVATLPEGLLPVTLATPTERLRADLAQVVTALPEALRAQPTGLSATSVDHIELLLASGATVFWGSSDQSAFKGEVASALIVGVAASYYDVSSPSHPSTR
jgi:cell division protein FtsQ